MGGLIQCWVDITSPASYFAFVLLKRQRELLRSHGVEVKLYNMFIGAVVVGSKNKSPFEIPAKLKYNPIDFERSAKYYNIPYAGFPKYMPASSAAPERALYYIEENYPAEKYESVWLALFEAFWARELNVSKPDALEKVLKEHFDDSAVGKILAATKEQKYKDALSNETKRCMENGAFGAPWFIVRNDAGQEQPFWGSDRFHFIFDFLGLPVQQFKVLEKSNL